MAAEIEVREVWPGDAAELAVNIRAADRAELAALGVEPLYAIVGSVRNSWFCHTATVGGRVACMLGVAPASLLSNEGRPWLLGTDLVTRYGGALGKRTGPYIQRMLAEFPVLKNHVHAKNVVAVRWLRRVGFLLQDPIVLPNGEVFYPFEMRAEECVKS